MMVGMMVVSFFSPNIQSTQAASAESSATPAVSNNGVFLDSGLTETNAKVDVLANLSSALLMPGSHTLTTNASGAQVHHFNLQPVVTNMTALTNDLPQLEQKQAVLDQEMKSLPGRERILRESWIQDYKIVANIVSNFVPADAEGKKMKVRMVELEKELNQLRVEFQKKLETDSEYRKAMAKQTEDAAAVKVLQDRRSKIREERSTLLSQIWVINELKRRELNKQAATNEPKPVVP